MRIGQENRARPARLQKGGGAGGARDLAKIPQQLLGN